MRPRISFEKRHIPLNVRAKFRITKGFCTAKGAIHDPKVKSGMRSHASEEGSHILDGMRGNGQDAIAFLRHGMFCPNYARAAWNLKLMGRSPEREYNRFARSVLI